MTSAQTKLKDIGTLLDNYKSEVIDRVSLKYNKFVSIFYSCLMKFKIIHLKYSRHFPTLSVSQIFQYSILTPTRSETNKIT